MTISVIESGLHTLVVDQGRFGSRHRGIPWSGAADYRSYQLCNSILGNEENTPALEFSLLGPTLKANADLALSYIGPPCQLEIDGEKLNNLNTFPLKAGETLKTGSCSTGVRGYLGVRGGIHVTNILGSNSSLGPIKDKTKLLCNEGWCMRSHLCEEWSWQKPEGLVRVTHGPEFTSFKSNALFHKDFLVNQSSNRMGLRLQGPSFPSLNHEMLSEPVCPGTIQVARDGQLLVLGIDGQTIGGYPRIAQVIRADLDILGQLRPGTILSFNLVTEADAEKLWHDKLKIISTISLQLRTASGLFL